MNIISTQDLCYTYCSYTKKAGTLGTLRDFFKREKVYIHAVQNVTVSIGQGEMVGLLGKNGAGKTTFIKLLIGLITPASGKISVMGYEPYKKNRVLLKKIGLVLGQKSQLVWDLPPVETLDMLGAIYGIPGKKCNAYLTYLSDLFDVRRLLYTPVRKLSLGERMKFELICALIHKPDILFLDEPTIGLDLETQREIYRFLKQINEESHTTVLITSHYMNDITALAGRVLILNSGKLVCDKKIDELLKMHNRKLSIVVESSEIPVMKISDRKINRVAENTYEIEMAQPEQTTAVMKDILMHSSGIKSIAAKTVPLEEIILDYYHDGEAEGHR